MIDLGAVLIVWFATRWPAGRSYWLAFIVGLLQDLTAGYRLGFFATAYLLTVLLINLFRTKFQYNRFYLLLFVVVSQIILFFYARAFA